MLPNRERAINTIQSAWRMDFKHKTTRRIVDKHFISGPTIQHVKSISFEALVVLLREKPLIQSSKACLHRIHRLTTIRHGSPPNALIQEPVNVRVFLAGYMIAYRPTHVFESMGVLEQALYDSAVPLMVAFERICSSVCTAPNCSFQEVSHELTRDFPFLLLDFIQKFKAWKGPDEA